MLNYFLLIFMNVKLHISLYIGQLLLAIPKKRVVRMKASISCHSIWQG